MRFLLILLVSYSALAGTGCPSFSEDALRVKLQGVEALKTAKHPLFTLETSKKVVKSVDLKGFDLAAPSYRWDLVLRSSDIARACENVTDEVEVLVCDDANGNGSCRDERAKHQLLPTELRYAYPLLPMDLILRLHSDP